MPTKSHLNCLTLIILLFLSACSSNNNIEVKELFLTEIRADGSKMFDFSLHRSKNKQAKPTNNTRPATRTNKRRVVAKDNSVKTSKKPTYDKVKAMEAELIARLNNRLAQNQYCRTGYLELERSLTKLQLSIRGECHESATAQDRKKFSN